MSCCINTLPPVITIALFLINWYSGNSGGGGEDDAYAYIKEDSLKDFLNIILSPDEKPFAGVTDETNFKRSCSLNIAFEKGHYENIFQTTTTENTNELPMSMESSSKLIDESLSDIILDINSSTDKTLYTLDLSDISSTLSSLPTSRKSEEDIQVFDVTFSITGTITPDDSTTDITSPFKISKNLFINTESLLEQHIMNGYFDFILEQKASSSIKSVHTNSFKCL